MPEAFGFLGKGGVGKTTLSLALGRVLSRRGPTLVISLDPAHNLGDLAGVRLEDTPREVRPGLFLQEVDLEGRVRAFRDELRNLIRSRFPRLLYLAEPLKEGMWFPGDQEEALLRAMLDALEQPVDHVVLDMPPTGMALRVLGWASYRKRWLEALVRWREQIAARKRQVLRLWGREEKDTVLERLRMLLGQEDHRRAKIREVRWWVVETPDPLARKEAERIQETLAREGWSLMGVIRNRDPEGIPLSRTPLEEAETWFQSRV